MRRRQIRTALRLARQTGCLGLPKAMGFLMVLTEPRALPCCRGTSWLPLGFVAQYSACKSQKGLEKWLLRRLQGSDGVLMICSCLGQTPGCPEHISCGHALRPPMWGQPGVGHSWHSSNLLVLTTQHTIHGNSILTDVEKL